ncbi:MAG: ribonuclease HII [Oscillospiraceae bacterium]|nr:ribonuclease HII [Oscillospiraceae bacterium]
MANFEPMENALSEQGYSAVCGVDEAGRGPLAGPVYAAAVILKPDSEFEGLDDSKKLTEKKRESLFEQIIKEALAYKIVAVDHKTIDELNILNATMLAMKTAVEGLSVSADYALIDGNKTPGLSIPSQYVIGGDAKVKSIAAASILAKVSRDRYMLELAEKYPQYQFEKHKGYGTKLHYQMLDEHGISDIHRMSFLKKYIEARKNGR